MLLLDTHVLIWLATDLTQLSPRVKLALREHSDHLYVSSISALEIGLLHNQKRIDLTGDPSVFIETALQQHGLQEISVDQQIAWASTQLKDIHSDPFDRILIATAKLHAMKLVTKDRIIPTYPGVKTIW